MFNLSPKIIVLYNESKNGDYLVQSFIILLTYHLVWFITKYVCILIINEY